MNNHQEKDIQIGRLPHVEWERQNMESLLKDSLAREVELTAEVARLRAAISGLWNRTDILMNVTAQKELQDALSQLTPVGFGDKVFKMLRAANHLTSTVAEFGENPEFIHENFQNMSDALVKLTPEELKLLEVTSNE